MITRDHHVIGDGKDFLPSTPDGLVVLNALSMTVETDLDRDISTRKLPGIRVIQPRVRSLQLRPVRRNELLEDTVFVAKSVTPDRELSACAGIEITSSQTAKTAVSERSITFAI